jgi:hypothetical protein
MAPEWIFKTLADFNRGYTGPQTLKLEEECRSKIASKEKGLLESFTSNEYLIGLAGRQDNFCLICGDHAKKLYPQIGPKEIHLCPRKFCSKCYHIQPGWKDDCRRFQDEIYQVYSFVTICCSL